MKKNKCGLTFVEIMISIGVLSVLGLAIFKLMTYANENTAKSRCRSDLRLSANIVARQLEKDVASSRAKIDDADMNTHQQAKSTIKFHNKTGPIIVEMEVPKGEENSQDVTYFTTYKSTDTNTDSEKVLYEKVQYTLNRNKELFRNNKKLASNIESIYFETSNNNNILNTTYDGKTQITIVTSAKPDGQQNEEKFTNQFIVSIRQLQEKRLRDSSNQNTHWRQRVDESNY